MTYTCSMQKKMESLKCTEAKARMGYVALESTRDTYILKDCVEYTMSVSDLADELSMYNADNKVVISNDGGYTYCAVTTDSFVETEECIKIVVTRDAYFVEDVISYAATVGELVDYLGRYSEKPVVFCSGSVYGAVSSSCVGERSYTYDNGEPEFYVGLENAREKIVYYQGSNKKVFGSEQDAREYIQSIRDGAVEKGIVVARVYDKDDDTVCEIDLATGQDI